MPAVRRKGQIIRQWPNYFYKDEAHSSLRLVTDKSQLLKIMIPLHMENTARDFISSSNAGALSISAKKNCASDSISDSDCNSSNSPGTSLSTRHLQQDPEENAETGAARRSAVRYRDNAVDGSNGNTSGRTRDGHLLVLLPLSRRDSASDRQLIEFRVYVELSAFLAFKHIEERSGAVLPALTRRLESCDFHWTYEHHDTGFSPIRAASAALDRAFGAPAEMEQQDLSPENADSSNANEATSINATTITAITTTLPVNQSNLPLDLGGSVSIVANDDMFDEGQGDRPVVEEEEESVIFSQQAMENISSTEYNSSFSIQVIEGQGQKSGVYVNETSPPTIEVSEHDMPSPEDSNIRQLREVHEISSEGQPVIQQPRVPFAIMGAARSLVSQTIGYLGEALDLPQISSSSTASSLDILSLFARTIPTNSGDAHAIMAYLNQLGVEHVGLLFIKDSWGKAYERDLQIYAKVYNVTIYSAAYVDEDDLESVMQQLRQSRCRYFFGVINPSTWKRVVRVAYQNGLMGNSDYQWFFGDLVELVGNNFVLDREVENDIADALSGTGVVLLKVQPHAAFDRAMATFANNKMMQQDFIQSHAEPHIFDNYTFTSFPGRSLFQYLTYDAVVALGLTACDTPGLFTAQEFYKQLLKIDFHGVSGQVRLHETTGTRLGEGFEYEIVNLVSRQPTDQSPFLSFEARSSVLVNLTGSGAMHTSQNVSLRTYPLIQEDVPFIYYDGTESPPMFLPPIEEDMNLIPDSLRYFGLSLAFMIMAFSIACAIFTYSYRMEFVVRASQPIFLAQICFGTFILAATIIPLSFQEDMPGLNIACALNPWLLCIGFTVTIAALFTKAHRINKLTNSGTTFRRVQVQAKDVMKPFLVLLSINIVFLTGWTASPYRLSWYRKPVANLDEFGRSVESFGMCKAGGGSMSLIFVIPLLLANVTVMAIATYESYKGRSLPSDFSEARYLAVAMIFLCETIVLGGTTIAAVLTNPTAFFLVSSLVLCLGCLSILLPVFWPKYMQRHKKEQTGRQASTMFNMRSAHQGASASALSCGVSGLSAPRSQPLTENEVNSSPRPSLVSQSSAFFASHPQAIKRNPMDDSVSKNSETPRRQSRMNSVTLSRLGSSYKVSDPSNSIMNGSGMLGSVRVALDSSVRNLLDNIGGNGNTNDDGTNGSSSLTRVSRPIVLSTLPEVQTNLERSNVMENSLAAIPSENENTSGPMDMSAVTECEESGAEKEISLIKDTGEKVLSAPVPGTSDNQAGDAYQ